MSTTDFEHLTQKQVADVFKVDVRTIRRWTVCGCPRNQDDRTYCLAEVIRWHADRWDRHAGVVSGW